MSDNPGSSNPVEKAAKQARYRRVKTPTVIQMEAVECGAAALGIVLAYYGQWVPLEELRVVCGISRDGSKANNIAKAARAYGLAAKGFRKEPASLRAMTLPLIVFWNLNHFLVVEGFGKNKVYLNDPASGPRVVSEEEFDQSFTGIVLELTPTPAFQKTGGRTALISLVRRRLAGSHVGLTYILLVSLVLLIPGLIIPTFTRLFIDYILNNQRDWIQPLLLGMALTLVLRALLMWIQQVYLLRMETRLALSMSSKFFWHLLRLPVEFFMQRYSGEIGARVAMNDNVARFLSGELANNVLNIILIVFYAMLMFQYDVVLTLIGIAIAALNLIALQVISRRRVDINQRLLKERGKLMGVSMHGLQLIESLKAGGRESDFFAQWAGYQAKALNAEQQLGLSTQALTAVPTFLAFLNTTAILAIGGLRVMDGRLSMGMLIAFLGLMANFIGPVTGLLDLGSRLQEMQGDMNRLDDVFKYTQDSRFLHETALIDDQTPRLDGCVDLKNVTFGYSRLEAPLIENFCLSLKPGSRVALVGSSGSGKSTVSKLIAGLYEPWSGEILFDRQPRSAIPPYTMTNSVAMVDQDIFMFEGSIRDNLTLWDSTIPEANIIRAAKDACIHDTIADRRKGYDYLVEEGGRNFSGGQRQRLEIARALVNNPSILILDEATSALDPILEKQIDDNLRRRGCTCLIVAHRLSTIRDCDEIIVLEQGKVVQRGTHESLHSIDGPYLCLIRGGPQDSDELISILDRLI